MSLYWTSGCGRIELEFESLEQAQSCTHPGPCDEDVRALSQVPFIRAQLDKADPQHLREDLNGYGAWDEEELADHEQNLQRMLWLAAGSVVDESSTSEETS